MPRRIYTLACYILIFGFSPVLSVAQAQPQPGKELSGRVYTTDHQAINDVSISLYRLPDSTQVSATRSGTEGQFTLSVVDTGQYLLMARHLGHELAYQTVAYKDSTTSHYVNIIMSPLVKTLSAVTVTAKRDAFEMGADRIVVNVGGNALLSGGSVYDALAKTPRIQVDPISKTIRVDGRSGLLVYLNNRQVYLTLDQITKYLEALPANSVDRIEVITNPSARYDASGGTVLSIFTKRSSTQGTTVDFTLTPGVGRFGKIGGTLGVSVRKSSWSAYALYTPQVRSTYFSYTVDQYIDQPPLTGSIHGTQFRRIDTRQQGLRVGSEVNLGTKTIIGTNLYTYQQAETTVPVSQTNYLLSDRLVPASSVSARTVLQTTLVNALVNINARRILSALKGSVSTDLDYATYQDNARTLATYRDRAETADNSLQSYFPLNVQLRSLKIDAEAKPTKSLSLEAGAKISQAIIRTRPTVDAYSEVFTSLITNLVVPFNYHETVQAAYVNASAKGSTISWQAGLRAERSQIDGATRNTDFRRDYTNLFPSLNIQWLLPTKAQFTFALNRRIIRPNFSSLNPVYVFFDPFTIVRGNPALVPQLTTSAQLSYQLQNKHTWTLTYLRTADRITEVIYRQDSLSPVLYNTQINFDKESRLTASYSFPLQITKNWRMQTTITGQQVRYATTVEDQYSLVDQRTVVLNNTHAIKIGSAWTADAQLLYRSTAAIGFMRYKPLMYINIGLGRSLWQGRGSLKLAANDVFHTLIISNYGEYINTNVRFRHRYESQQLFLTLTYRLGNNKLESVVRRKTALESEQERLKKEVP